MKYVLISKIYIVGMIFVFSLVPEMFTQQKEDRPDKPNLFELKYEAVGRIKKMLESADTDGDGNLSEKELEIVIDKAIVTTKKGMQVQCDKDKDGKLDDQENEKFQKLCKIFEQQHKTLKVRLSKFDENNDKFISRDELNKYYEAIKYLNDVEVNNFPDYNEDGKCSREEYEKFMEEGIISDIRKALKKYYDIDADGKLTDEEKTSIEELLNWDRERWQDAITGLFKKYDSDKDDFISKEELKKLMEEIKKLRREKKQ